MINIVTNDKAKSLILTEDRELRNAIVNMLNTAAFPAEKVTVHSLDEMIHLARTDRMAVNLVVDANAVKNEKVDEVVTKISELINETDARVLFIYSSAFHDVSKIKNVIQDAARFRSEENSATKQVVQGFFHQKFVPRHVLLARANQEAEKPAAPADTKASSAPSAKQLPFFEASQHVRDTIGMLNKLTQTSEAVQELITIGQRFNGMIGAFAFFGNQPGFKELMTLARQIDDVSRHYASQKPNTIVEAHKQFMIEASKCSLLLLKDLRESLKISEENTKLFTRVNGDFEKLDGIKGRSSQSQSEIDTMLDDLLDGKKAS